MYKCNSCGLCCRNIGGIDLYKDLDNGNGICRYLDQKTNLCSIYDSRPLKCRVDKSYEEIFKNEMSLEKYYKLNYEACAELKRRK